MMQKLACTVGLALSLLVASAPIGVAQIIGDWAVDHTAMGAGETYSFRPDGTYEYKIWEIQLGRRKLVQAEAGTYEIQRELVALYPRGGTVKSYSWQLGKDPYIGTPMLFLRDASGREEQFYASSNSPDRRPDPGKKSCGETFVDCNIAGKPYSYCQKQLEACDR